MSKEKFLQASHDFGKTNGQSFVEFNREPSLTRQEFAEECDINVLMERTNAHVHGGPGGLPPGAAQMDNYRSPMYFDFADIPQDLLGVLQFMEGAENAFMTLPAVVRKEFDNSAHEFVAYASDPGNIEQMRSWGLAPPAKPPEQPVAPVQVPLPTAAPGAVQPPAPGAPTHGST